MRIASPLAENPATDRAERALPHSPVKPSSAVSVLLLAASTLVLGCGARPAPAIPHASTPTSSSATTSAATVDASEEAPSTPASARAHRVSALEGAVTFTMTALKAPRVKTTNDASGLPRTTVDVDLSDRHSVRCTVYSNAVRGAYVLLRELAEDVEPTKPQEAPFEEPTIDVTASSGRVVLWGTSPSRNVALALRPRWSLACRSAKLDDRERFRAFFEETIAKATVDPADIISPKRVALYKLLAKGKVIGFEETATYEETDGPHVYGRVSFFGPSAKTGWVAVDVSSSTTSNKRGEEVSHGYDRAVDGRTTTTLTLKKDPKGYAIAGTMNGAAFDRRLGAKPIFATDTPLWLALLKKTRAPKARDARFTVFSTAQMETIPVVIKRRSATELAYVEGTDEVVMTVDDEGPTRLETANVSAERVFVGGGK